MLHCHVQAVKAAGTRELRRVASAGRVARGTVSNCPFWRGTRQKYRQQVAYSLQAQWIRV